MKGVYPMANIAYDFLTESFLFDERYIENRFKKVSEQELSVELQKYRKHIREHYLDIVNEIKNKSELNVTIESAGELPNQQLLKQLVLYMDTIVISDPIFEFTQTKSNMHEPMSRLMGVNSRAEIDRVGLANSAQYMKITTPLVSTQFVKYVPISLIHEPPKELPILYSSDNFSSELSEELYKFFYKNAKVNNVIIKDGNMQYSIDDKLSIGTTIAVNFDHEHIRNGHIYQFLKSKKYNFDETTGKFKLMQYIPDTISRNEFEMWVKNSINRAAISEFQTTLNEAILAQKLRCMYMAKSQFTADLLSQTIAKNDVNTGLANLSMKLELPILNEISADDLANIRANSGEAFYNFRTELNKKLLMLRDITDKDELQRELENISYEMNHIQVYEVKKEYKKILRSFSVDAVALTGSLVTSFFTGGLTLIGAAGALAKGGIDYIKYLNEVKENNGYFLWKLNQ